MRERNSFGWLLCILIIAAFFRLYQLETLPPGLHPEEAFYGIEAFRHNSEGFRWSSEFLGTGGLFRLLQAFVLSNFDLAQPWVLRFGPAIAGVLAVIGVYFLGRELFSKRAGLFAAFFAATSAWHVIFSRVGSPDMLAPLFFTWALFFFHRAVNREANDTRYLGGAIAAGLAAGLGFHTSPDFLWLLPVFLVFIPFRRKRPGFWRVCALTVAVAALFALPAFSKLSAPTPMVSPGTVLGTLGMFHLVGDMNWLNNLPGRPELFWPVGLLFLWGSLLGITNLAGSHRHFLTINHEKERAENWEFARNLRLSFYLMFAWFVLGFFFAAGSGSAPDARAALLLTPPIFLLAGIGSIAVYSFFRAHLHSSVLRIGTALFCVLLLYEAYQTYFILWARNPDAARAFHFEHAEVGRIVNRLLPNQPKAVIYGASVPRETVMFITRSWDERGRRAVNLRHLNYVEASDLPEEVVEFFLP